MAFEEHKCLLRVWILNESCGQMEWILKHDKDLNPMLAHHRFNQRVHGHWILEDINYNWFRSIRSLNDFKEASTERIYEWDSDNDDVDNIIDMAEERRQFDRIIALAGEQPVALALPKQPANEASF